MSVAYLLDTDTFSRSFRGDETIRRRIQEADAPVFLSMVSAREALKGALATVADAESPNARFRGGVAEAYRYLFEIVAYIHTFPLYPYSDEAERLFQSWPKSVHRIGPRDCRVAASALASDMVVVTCNTTDFARIAETALGLRFTDWSL